MQTTLLHMTQHIPPPKKKKKKNEHKVTWSGISLELRKKDETPWSLLLLLRALLSPLAREQRCQNVQKTGAWWNQKQNKERIVNNKEKQNQTRQQFQNLLRHKSIGHYAAWWRHSDVLSTRLVLFPRLTNSDENTQNCITKLVAFDSINCLLSARHKAITLFKTVV